MSTRVGFVGLGNMGLPNTRNAYKDNRVEVLFARTADVATAGSVSVPNTGPVSRPA